MNRLKEFWVRRLLRPIMEQLQQGSSPRDLVRSVAWGFTLALFPLLGSTTILCATAGTLFKLNHVVMQSVNYLAYPLQIALIIPFLKMGDWIYGVKDIPYSLNVMVRLFEANPSEFFAIYGRAILRACSAWLFLSPVIVFLIAILVRRPIANLSARIRAS